MHLQSVVQSDGEKNQPTLFVGEDYLKCLNLLSHSVRSSETQKANGRGAGLHQVGAAGLLAVSDTPAAPPRPGVLCQGRSVCPPAARGPAPSGFSLDFSLRPVSVRINPTGVINVATDLGSADFIPEYGVLHASSLKGTYKNNTVLHGLHV